MGLRGRTVRVIVSNTEFNLKNLFGTIISDRGYKQLKVKVISPISVSTITSSIIELTFINEEETFHSLENLYGLNCQCSLIDEQNAKSENMGEVTVAID